MELKYLEIFLKVVECGSFSKAADALCLTQPTVSIHIKTLEDEFSTRLLDRLGKRVAPTRAGEILYGYARDIVRLKSEAGDAINQFCGRMKGELRIGASTIPGEYMLPAVVGGFKALYPEVYPILKIGSSRTISEMVLQGEADIGVAGYQTRERELASREFGSDELVLVCGSSFEKGVITREELKGVPLYLRERGSGSRASLEKALAERGMELKGLNIAGELGSTQALKEALRHGPGLAFISRIAVSEQIESGALKEVEVRGLRIKRSFHVITSRTRHPSPVALAFMEYLLKGRNV